MGGDRRIESFSARAGARGHEKTGLGPGKGGVLAHPPRRSNDASPATPAHSNSFSIIYSASTQQSRP
jgi:hypothetical protein